ncbi:MAG TPA: AAA family ATPase [bacterium]|nr:AAA family ATPase [bacterium]
MQQLLSVIRDAQCVVEGHDTIKEISHIRVLEHLVSVFKKNPEVTLLNEPSIVRSTERPPDIVVIDPFSGVHVIEVKGWKISEIEEVKPGPVFQVRFQGRQKQKNPIKQAKNAMFDIKNASEKAAPCGWNAPFFYWVVFPFVTRAQWNNRWQGLCEWSEFFLGDDIANNSLKSKLQAAGQSFLKRQGLDQLSDDEIKPIFTAFGDTAVLYDLQNDASSPRELTLGEYFNELAVQEKRLSHEQQEIAAKDWTGGPRLIRGVAGSGKTVVLATNLARRIGQVTKNNQAELFESGDKNLPTFLAVCFNRSLVPFIREKVKSAYAQRTGNHEYSAAMCRITHLNGLLWELSQENVLEYIKIGYYDRGEESDHFGRANSYLKQIQDFKTRQPEWFAAIQYDAVYIDEGQDLLEDEFKFLIELCKTSPNSTEPNIYIFYDDAQNLYGRPRPTWDKIGLRIVGGRSYVMVECFRNTRQIVEPAFNVLLGSTADETQRIQTKTFADTNYLEKERRVISWDGQLWRVRFAERQGEWPEFFKTVNRVDELELALRRIRWLIETQDVRPEDILVLGPTRERLRAFANVARNLECVRGLVLPFERDDKDTYITRTNYLTISTVNSAKGYDAYCVVLLSSNEFTCDTEGRAAFYVGCTRAKEHLDIFANGDGGLGEELRKATSLLINGSEDSIAWKGELPCER